VSIRELVCVVVCCDACASPIEDRDADVVAYATTAWPPVGPGWRCPACATGRIYLTLGHARGPWEPVRAHRLPDGRTWTCRTRALLTAAGAGS
jgi:hypothetical protein